MIESHSKHVLDDDGCSQTEQIEALIVFLMPQKIGDMY